MTVGDQSARRRSRSCKVTEHGQARAPDDCDDRGTPSDQHEAVACDCGLRVPFLQRRRQGSAMTHVLAFLRRGPWRLNRPLAHLDQAGTLGSRTRPATSRSTETVAPETKSPSCVPQYRTIRRRQSERALVAVQYPKRHVLTTSRHVAGSRPLRRW